MQYFYQGFWIFIGIVAGIGVNILTQKIINWKNEKNILKNFKFEIDFNVKKINRFLEYLRDYRDCVNGDSLNKFTKYFDLSRVIFGTTNNMLFSGLLYKYLSDENVENILIMTSQFTLYWENQINSNIGQHIANFNFDKKKQKEATLSLTGLQESTLAIQYYSKEEATSTAISWETFFKDHNKNLYKIQKEIKNIK